MSQMRITIRPVRTTDASSIYELMHMPNVLWGTLLLPSTTLDEWQTIVEEWTRDKRRHVFVAEVQEKVVGNIRLSVGQGRKRHVGEIVMAVHDKHQGHGIGKMLMMTVIDLADNWLNLVRLELDVYTDNERAISLYKLFDFEIEGSKRLNVFRGGMYLDSYMMARLRPPSPSHYTETLMRVPESPTPSETQQ